MTFSDVSFIFIAIYVYRRFKQKKQDKIGNILFMCCWVFGGLQSIYDNNYLSAVSSFFLVLMIGIQLYKGKYLF